MRNSPYKLITIGHKYVLHLITLGKRVRVTTTILRRPSKILLNFCQIQPQEEIVFGLCIDLAYFKRKRISPYVVL